MMMQRRLLCNSLLEEEEKKRQPGPRMEQRHLYNAVVEEEMEEECGVAVVLVHVVKSDQSRSCIAPSITSFGGGECH